MLIVISKPRIVVAAALMVALNYFVLPACAAPTGGFLAVSNSQTNGDGKRTVLFLDANDPSTPLFSVAIPIEYQGGAPPNLGFEEPQAITVDPSTGDVYVIAFDSGVTTDAPDPRGDSQGDLDLYKIPFATVYDHWVANYQGKDVRALALVDGASPAPNGVKNSLNKDFVTYMNASSEVFTNGANTNTTTSNRVYLPGSSAKIGEVVRGNGGTFFHTPIDFRDSSTLFMLDDSIEAESTNPQNKENDHSLRIIKKVSNSPGAATITTVTQTAPGVNYLNGGFNGNTVTPGPGNPTQSWESTLLQKLNMDATGHSEPRSFAYYDNGAGIRGYWIAEGNFSSTNHVSDQIGFLQLDGSNNAIGFRQFVGGATTAPISDDPAKNPSSNDGKITRVFVNNDGSLVLVENGNFDRTPVPPATSPGDSVHEGDQQPGVLQVSVDYNFGGSGQMQLGAWKPKTFLKLKPAGDYNQNQEVDAADYTVWKDNFGAVNFLQNEEPTTSPFQVTNGDFEVWKNNFGATGSENVVGGTELANVAAYDKVNKKVYFLGPNPASPFEADLFVVDLVTGATTAYADFNQSVGFYSDPADSDIIKYFFLSAGSGGVGGGTVPEPASMMLFAIGLAGLWLGRRLRSR